MYKPLFTEIDRYGVILPNIFAVLYLKKNTKSQPLADQLKLECGRGSVGVVV